MGVVTTGLHRFSNVTARSQFGVLQEVVPGATVYVTVTSTGLAATIYSDPEMTIQIPGALITTDTSGFYEYYVPAAYNVTEQITSTGGLNVTISNIVLNNGNGSFLPLTGGTLTGPLIGTSASFSSTVTGNSFTGPGTGLTGTAGSLSIGGTAATATNANQLLSQTWAVPAALGSTTPAAVTGTTVTATTQFSGPGTGLTGTAAGLNIGGNAATASNGVLVGSLTTTAAATDTVTLTGITSSSHVSLTATNASAAAMIAATYVSSKSADTLIITHTSTAGATFDIIATAN